MPAGTYEERFSDVRNSLQKYLFNECPAVNLIGYRILDIGCGDGKFTEELAVANPFLDIKGIEINPHKLLNVNQFPPERENLCFDWGNQADITIFPIRKEEYNVILYLGVHHKLPADRQLYTVKKLVEGYSDLLLIRTFPHYFTEFFDAHYTRYQNKFEVQVISPMKGYIQPLFIFKRT